MQVRTCLVKGRINKNERLAAQLAAKEELEQAHVQVLLCSMLRKIRREEACVVRE